MSSLVPFDFGILAFLAATIYIALDVGFSFTSVFGPSNPPDALGSIPLFVLTSIWPGAATILYFGIMAYVVLGLLNEVRPMWYYVLAAVLFVLSQLDYFLLSKVICKIDTTQAAATGGVSKVDGSFIATILETAAVGVLYLAWRSITEGASHIPRSVSMSSTPHPAPSRPQYGTPPPCGAALLSCLMSYPFHIPLSLRFVQAVVAVLPTVALDGSIIALLSPMYSSHLLTRCAAESWEDEVYYPR
ncbi:hypothetical protein OH76DRAFT_1561812 [Lentinus brumalis]|uniref:Uncharacterized protein n=1 Tax=Lentinus brumalis TaxID=2498619 RepID=A0A371CL85_9APHY|nr:hypothetical protein OH76DRAFT_1561812 [Polyporus brumalis]